MAFMRHSHREGYKAAADTLTPEACGLIKDLQGPFTDHSHFGVYVARNLR